MQGFEFFLDAFDGGQGVLTPAHDNHAANHFALAIQFGDATTHLRSQVNIGNVLQQHRRAVGVHAQRDLLKFLDTLDITRGAHHVFRFGHFNDRAADLLVTTLDGAFYRIQ